MKRTRHVLGITTYRENASENRDIEAYKLFKDGRKRRAAGIIAKYVKKKLLKKLKDVEITSCNPAIGVYDGGSEPSCIPVFHVRNILFNEGTYNYELLDMFKSFTNQDSILLYEITDKGHSGIKITTNEKQLSKLQKEILNVSDNKIGGYLTYDYITKSVTILNIKEFDELTDKQFTSYIPKINIAVKKMGGKLTVFHHQYKII